MHDYDRRRPTASSEETLTTHNWCTIDQSDIEKIATLALTDYSARLDKVSRPKRVSEYVIQIEGTTTDGRTFRSEVTFFMEDSTLKSTARTSVEGTVDMGPIPDSLVKLEANVAKLLGHFEAVRFQNHGVAAFARGFRNVGLIIERWRRGDVVDTKHLRSLLREMVKDIVSAYSKMEVSLRMQILPGETLELFELVESARKAIGAAARKLE